MAKPEKKATAPKGAEPVSPPAALPLREASAEPGVERVLVPAIAGSDGVARGEAVGDGTGVRLPDADPSHIGEPSTPLDVPEPRPATPPFEGEPIVYPSDAPNEREPVVPTLAEWLAAGYAEVGYCRRFGKNPTPNTPAAKADAKPALVHLAPEPDPNATRTYRVWQHGELHRNGKVYRPGDTLDLTDAVAASIGACVALVTPS